MHNIRSPMLGSCGIDEDVLRGLSIASGIAANSRGNGHRSAWTQYYGQGGNPSFGGNRRAGAGKNKQGNAKLAKGKATDKKREKAANSKDEAAKKAKLSAAKEESDGKLAQRILTLERVRAIQSGIPGVRDAPAPNEKFTLGTRTYRISQLLNKAEVATQVEIQRALLTNSLTGKPCGWFVCLRAQCFELAYKEVGGDREYEVVPARTCITQINGMSLRFTTDEFPVVFTTGVPGSTTDQMGNKEAAVFCRETSTAGPQQDYHNTKYHNIRTSLRDGHDRTYVTRPYGSDAGMLYTVVAFYQPATYDMANSTGTSVGFVSGELKVRTYERELSIPAGYKYVEEDLLQVVPIFDPLLITSGGYQDNYLGGEVVGKYNLVSGKAGAGEYTLAVASEGLASILAPAVTYKFQDGFDRNIKTTANQTVAQPVHYKYLRLCKIGGGAARPYVFSSFDACVNAKPEKGFLDEGSSVGTEDLRFEPVTGSWGSAFKGNLVDLTTRIPSSSHKKSVAYSVSRTNRHPDTVGALPMVLGDGPPQTSLISVETIYSANTAEVVADTVPEASALQGKSLKSKADPEQRASKQGR